MIHFNRFISTFIIAGLCFIGCDSGSDTGNLFESKPVIKVIARGLAVPDGSVLVAYAFTQAAYFFPPDSVSSGRHKFSNGAATAKLSPSMRDGLFHVFVYVDMDPDDENWPMQGDLLAGPINLGVSGGSGRVILAAEDFIPVNVSVQVDYSDPDADGKRVRVRVGTEGTPCQSDVTVEAYGVIDYSRARMGLAGLSDGTYSLCAVINMDNSLPVTSFPGGGDLVAADGAGLVVAGGTGAATMPEASIHPIPEFTMNLPAAPDGTPVVVTIVDPVSQMLQAFGIAEFETGVAVAPLLFWVLDGNWLAAAIIDADGSGPVGITMGDITGAVFIDVAGDSVLPEMLESDFITVNVLATINLSGHDGELVMLGIYPESSFCAGPPVGGGIPQLLGNGTTTIPAGNLPNGNYEACPIVDVDWSGGPTSGDLTAIHPFALNGSAQFTILEAEFFPIP